MALEVEALADRVDKPCSRSGFGAFRVHGLGFRAQGLTLNCRGRGFQVFRAQGLTLNCRVWGFQGFRAQGLTLNFRPWPTGSKNFCPPSAGTPGTAHSVRFIVGTMGFAQNVFKMPKLDSSSRSSLVDSAPTFGIPPVPDSNRNERDMPTSDVHVS